MRHLLLCGLVTLVVALAGHGPALASGSGQVDPPGNTVRTESGAEVAAYLANIDRMLGLAFSGQYGTLKPGSTQKLEAARERIQEVLGSRTTLGSLPADERMVLQNEEDAISAILRNREKDRMVCKRLLKTGSRMATTECMTVAQREARAASAAESTSMVQREKCVPSIYNPC